MDKPPGIPWYVTSISRWLNSRLGLRIVVARDVDLLEQKRNELLFGSAVFFFCDSILKSVLAVLFQIAFSFSRRRIGVRVLNAERKISYCVQDDFTRFFKISSVKETIRNFTHAES